MGCGTPSSLKATHVLHEEEEKLKYFHLFLKVNIPCARFRPGEGLTAFVPPLVVSGPRPEKGASFSCSGPAQLFSTGAPFDPDELRLRWLKAHEILSQQSQVSSGTADGRYSLSARGIALDHSAVFRDVGGESCSGGECSRGFLVSPAEVVGSSTSSSC